MKSEWDYKKYHRHKHTLNISRTVQIYTKRIIVQ